MRITFSSGSSSSASLVVSSAESNSDVRARTTRFHFLREGLDLPEIFLQLDFRDEGALTPLRVSHAQAAKRFECLAGGHAADTKAFGEHLFGRKGFAGLEAARADFLEEVLVDLEVERDGALAVKAERVLRSFLGLVVSRSFRDPQLRTGQERGIAKGKSGRFSRSRKV
ncbi:MAG TPA: hypothetical protein VKB66_03460 [Candidatus Acidoferrum sp.]|nr:hypothetical protein [Candidatus Acidoferrum sp.]